MKHISKLLIILFIPVLFSSCAVINSLLGINECNYSGCDRQCIDNCNYCDIHCDRYYVPEDLDKKINESINKQMDQYRKEQERNKGK